MAGGRDAKQKRVEQENRNNESNEGKGKTKGKENKKEYLAVIRVRGRVKVRAGIGETLKRLRLNKPNHCVIVPKNETYLGMINKAKDYITWGEVNREVITLLDKKASKEEEGIYRLHPPLGGYERGGIKRTYSKGGAIGYRGKDIAKLIERMLKNMEKH